MISQKDYDNLVCLTKMRDAYDILSSSYRPSDVELRDDYFKVLMSVKDLMLKLWNTVEVEEDA
jgi:hypothetical protein